MTISGDVSIMGLPQVFDLISSNGLDGLLLVTARQARISIPFHQGAIHFLPEGTAKPRSGLVKRGDLADMLSRGKALKKKRPPTRRRQPRKSKEPERTRQSKRPSGSDGPRDLLSEVLRRARSLDNSAKRLEVSEVILEAFTWFPATFSFQPGRASVLGSGPEEGKTLSIDPPSLLLEAARRIDESDRGGNVHLNDPTWGSAVRIRRGFLQGTLEGVGLAAVLQTLQSERLSGTLSIQGQGEQRLHFLQGEVFLYRDAETDADSLKEFLGESWGDDLQFVQIAASAGGKVSEEDLPEGEAHALKEAFFDTLFWDDASFEFLLDALPDDFDEPKAGASRIALRSERFLLEAVQRLNEWDELRSFVGGGEAVYRFTSADAKLEAVQTFGPPELLTLIDGRITLGELARRTGLEYLEVARVVHDLLTIDLITRVTKT